MKNNALHHLEIDSGTIKIDGMKMKGVLSYTLKESARDLPELHLVIALPKKISLANKSTTCYNRRTKTKGDEEMDAQKIEQLSTLLAGLKQYEWCKIAHIVQRQYDSASNKLELSDAEDIKKLLNCELNGYSSTI